MVPTARIALPLADPLMSQPRSAQDEESQLVARARAGDMAAFEQLYHTTSSRVYSICLRMSGERATAAELTHDVYVRAWERLAQYRQESAFGTWLYRLTVNFVLERLRSDKRREARVRLVDDEATEHAVETAADLTNTDVLDRIDLQKAIAALPRNARQVFVLHDIEGYQHDEIAEQMQLAPGTVRAHLHRARKLLMARLSR